MTDIEKKALALVNEVFKERGLTLDGSTNRTSNSYHEALCRAIEQHEAFKREVSDAVERALYQMRANQLMQAQVAPTLTCFVIPKPDPLVEAWLEAFPGNHIDDARDECAKINAALAARGLTITETKEKN